MGDTDTLMNLAAQTGNVAIAQLLKERGVSINSPDDELVKVCPKHMLQ